jgi:hypothetical protein
MFTKHRRPRSTTPRRGAIDSQKRKVYAAEGAAFADLSSKDVDLRSHTQCEIWINRQLQRARLRTALREIGVVIPDRVRIHPVGHSGGGGRNAINASKWMRNKMSLLHELAHVLNDYGGYMGKAGHGWEYCRVYLLVVRHVLGSGWEKKLKVAFKKHGVRFRPKRELSPERRAALVERLASYRAKAPRAAAMAPPSHDLPPEVPEPTLQDFFLLRSYR